MSSMFVAAVESKDKRTSRSRSAAVALLAAVVLGLGSLAGAPTATATPVFGAWDAVAAPEQNAWQSVAYGNGVWVAVASDGASRIMRSTDGVNWSAIVAPEQNEWRSVAYGSGVWVAVASTGANRVMRSTDDGLTWTASAAVGDYQWASVAYGLDTDGSGIWIAVASGGTNKDRVMKSSDGGSTWRQITTLASTKTLRSVAYGDGKWCAIGSGGTNPYMHSTTGGESWSATASTGWAAAVGNGRCVIVGNSITGSYVLGGTAFYVPAAQPVGQWRSIAYGNGTFVMVAADGASTGHAIGFSGGTGTSWMSTASIDVNNTWSSVAFGGGRWVAVASAGSGARIATAGEQQVMTPSPETGGPASVWKSAKPTWSWGATSVAYGNGVWIAVAVASSMGPGLARSVDDGTTWSAVAVPENNSWRSVAYGNGVWVAVASTGTNRVMRSTDDGVTWTAVTAAEANSWYGLSYGNGTWAAVAASGTQRVMRSTDDGLTWSSVVVPAGGWASVAYGGGVWIATSDGEYVSSLLRSTDDGLTWSLVSTPAPFGWTSAAYGNGVWVVVGRDTFGLASGPNRILTSDDGGLTWHVRAGTGNAAWTAVGFGGSTFIAVADSTIGTIARSGPPVPLVLTTNAVPAATHGSAYTATLLPSGGQYPYTWAVTSGALPAGLSLDASTGVISGTPTAAGTRSFAVQVTDADGATATAGLSVAVAAPTPTISGGGTGPFTYGVVGTLPPGVALDPNTGQLTGTPTVAGSWSFQIEVTDALGATAAVTVPVVSVVDPLAVVTTTLPSATRSAVFASTLTAAGGIAPYTWSIESGSLPAGLMLNASTGAITGTPTGVEAASFTVGVTDAGGTTSTTGLSLAVNPPIPSIPGGSTGIPTYSVVGTLPPGVTFDPATGQLTGTPTEDGSWTFDIVVTDTTGATASVTVPIVSVIDPMTVATSALPSGTANTAYGARVAAVGGVGPCTWAVASASLPPGLTLNPTTGSISGTPTAAGSWTFTVRAVDIAGRAGSKTLTLAVAAPVPTITGGTAPFTYTVIGDLPPGVTFDPATGIVTGTSTVSGSWSFQIEVQDSLGATAQVTVPFVRALLPVPPVGSSGDGSKPATTTTAPAKKPTTTAATPPVAAQDDTQTRPPLAGQLAAARLRFPTGSAVLQKATRAALTRVAQQAKAAMADGAKVVTVVSVARTTGATLARARGNAIKAALRKAGLPGAIRVAYPKHRPGQAAFTVVVNATPAT